MLQFILVALGAGGASALLFASVASGSLLATLLFYLAPLPILIAALGWGHQAGLLAGLAAAGALGASLGIAFCAVFLVAIALPAWWLGYLSLLARPLSGNGSTPELQWYPAGRLLLWTACIGALLVLLAIPNFGTDKESLQAGLREAFEQAIRTQAPAAGPDGPFGPDGDRLLGVLVNAMPPLAAALATLIGTINLWLAGRIVKVSDRLRRPWPDLSGITLPQPTPTVVAAAIAASLLPGMTGIVAGVIAASLLTAYAILGFAVLHAITRGVAHRGLALAGTYAAVIVLGWPVLAMSLLGLADAAFNIRARFSPRQEPPDLRHT
jgi:hypothetical protein